MELIAGDLLGKTGPAFTFSPVILASLKLNKDGEFEFEIHKDFNCSILILEGDVIINGSKALENQLVLFHNDGQIINIKANVDSILLVMAGEPLNEPIFSYGPFLMNTKQEIIEAIEDFNAGKFGELE